jgi:hypothetical protein
MLIRIGTLIGVAELCETIVFNLALAPEVESGRAAAERALPAAQITPDAVVQERAPENGDPPFLLLILSDCSG